MGVHNRATKIRHLTDVSTTTPSDGQTLVWDDAEGEYVPGASGSFDPDDPLDYFTMRDGDDVLWTVTMGTDGAFVTTSFEVLLTEDGDLLTTESGDLLALES